VPVFLPSVPACPESQAQSGQLGSASVAFAHALWSWQARSDGTVSMYMQLLTDYKHGCWNRLNSHHLNAKGWPQFSPSRIAQPAINLYPLHYHENVEARPVESVMIYSWFTLRMNEQTSAWRNIQARNWTSTPLKTLICQFISFPWQKAKRWNNVPEHLFHMSSVSHIIPLQTMSKISNTNERFST